MSTELEALARHAVACKHWRWMEGMACQWNQPRSGAGGQQVMPTWARVVDLPTGPLPLTYCLIDVHSVYRFAYPDLSDPATLGCLLALVREAWGAGVHLVPDGGWLVRGARLPERNDPGVCHPGATVNLGICAKTEAEALVAALEAAP